MITFIFSLCYTKNVHKPLYASGFLYHVATQQILLHQANSDSNPSSLWSMVGGINKNGEEANAAFQRILYELIHVRLDGTCMYPVYDYYDNAFNTIHYVCYAEVKKVDSFPLLQKGALTWFTFKQTTKLSFRDQTKQDIIVSERVIKAQARSVELRTKPIPGML